MALGHYMREIGQVQGCFPGGKHPKGQTPKNMENA